MIEGAKLTSNAKRVPSSLCVCCELPITDQYIYRVAPDMQCHEKCLKCIECGKSLEENSTCYVKNNKVYCKHDYQRVFTKCFRCNLNLNANDYVMKCKANLYHTDCFFCDICNKKLKPGDEFQLKENNMLVCKEDSLSLPGADQFNQFASSCSNKINISALSVNTYDDSSSFSPCSSSIESPIPPMSHSMNIQGPLHAYNSMNHNYNSMDNYLEYDYQNMKDDDDDDNDDSMSEKNVCMKNMRNKNTGKMFVHQQTHSNFSSSSSPSSSSTSSNHANCNNSKPARIRTVLNEKQLHMLRTCYGANPRPDALMKEQLVEMTGLSSRVIRVWFQNKRCKDKKKTMNGRDDPDDQHMMFAHCF